MRALIFMARCVNKDGKDIFTVDEIVEKEDLPGRFLRKILQCLAQKGILSSHKGKDGGFSFLKSPNEIYLLDIVNIFQGKLDLTNCLLKGKVCPNVKKCLLREKLKKVNSLVTEELGKITVASLSKRS